MHSKILYKIANAKIELISKLFAYAMFVNGMMILMPPLLYSIIKYYFLNSGAESFFLFFPAWLVHIIQDDGILIK